MIRPPTISFSDFIIRKDGHGKNLVPLLKKNQLVEAIVKNVLSSSKVELIIAGKTILADISLLADNSLLLTRGETIKFQVTGDGNIKLIRPVQLLTGFNEINRSATPIMDLLSNHGTGLIKILEPFFLNGKNDFKDMSFHNLKNIFVYDAKKITDQDIKAHVLEFISKSQLQFDNPAEHLNDFSRVIEKFQVMNAHFSESGRYLIPFPIFFNGNLNIGQFFFDTGGKKDNKKRKNKRIIKASLLLQMSNLGAVRADLSVLERDISGMIQVSDQKICTFVKQMIPDLKKGLNKHGFHVLKMGCEVAEPEKFETTVLLDDVLYNETNDLSIII